MNKFGDSVLSNLGITLLSLFSKSIIHVIVWLITLLAMLGSHHRIPCFIFVV